MPSTNVVTAHTDLLRCKLNTPAHYLKENHSAPTLPLLRLRCQNLINFGKSPLPSFFTQHILPLYYTSALSGGVLALACSGGFIQN
jgi:hypothetical protein